MSASDYKASFYAREYNLKQLNRITKGNLKNALIFKPFDNNAIFPTDTTGVIPVYPTILNGGGLDNYERKIVLSLEIGALIAFVVTMCCGCAKL